MGLRIYLHLPCPLMNHEQSSCAMQIPVETWQTWNNALMDGVCGSRHTRTRMCRIHRDFQSA